MKTKQKRNQTNTPPVWKASINIIRLTRYYWLANAFALVMVYMIFQIPAFIMRTFFNSLQGLPVHPMFNLLTLVLALLGTGILYFLSMWIIYASNGPFFVHTHTLLRKNMLLNVFKQPGARALKNSAGEAISRFRGDAFELSLFVLFLNNIMGMTVFCVVAIFVMLKVSILVTLCALLPFLAVVIASLLVTGKVIEYRTKSRKATGAVTGYIGEIFGAIQAIKVALAEKGIIDRFEKLNTVRRTTTVKDVTFTSVLESIFRDMVAVGTGVIMIVSAKKIQAGTFSVGDFAIFVFYLSFVSEWTAFFGLMIARYNQSKVHIKRMTEVADSPDPDTLIELGPIYLKEEIPEVVQKAKSPMDELITLEVCDLSYTHPDSDNSIKNISFTIHSKSLTIITGRIGSGKTTLLQALLGQLPVETGSVKWNGQPVEQAGVFFTPPRCAYTPQVPKLLSLSLRDNITMGINADEERIEKALYQAVLEDDIKQLENGLGTVIGPKGVKLSGGQIQRAAAARMFFTNSELFVFDDLSSALDVDTEIKLWNRILNEKNMTCLAVSHRKPALKLADQIILLKDGMIEARGKLNELLESSEEMRSLWKEE